MRQKYEIHLVQKNRINKKRKEKKNNNKKADMFNNKQGSKDSSVVRAPHSRLKGRGFEPLQERPVNFLLQGHLSVLTLYFGIRSIRVLPQ